MLRNNGGLRSEYLNKDITFVWCISNYDVLYFHYYLSFYNFLSSEVKIYHISVVKKNISTFSSYIKKNKNVHVRSRQQTSAVYNPGKKTEHYKNWFGIQKKRKTGSLEWFSFVFCETWLQEKVKKKNKEGNLCFLFTAISSGRGKGEKGEGGKTYGPGTADITIPAHWYRIWLFSSLAICNNTKCCQDSRCTVV